MSKIERRILEVFKEAIWELCELRMEDISMRTRISDLDIDSVILLEIIGYLEGRFNVNVPEESLFKAKSISEIVRVIRVRIV